MKQQFQNKIFILPIFLSVSIIFFISCSNNNSSKSTVNSSLKSNTITNKKNPAYFANFDKIDSISRCATFDNSYPKFIFDSVNSNKIKLSDLKEYIVKSKGNLSGNKSFDSLFVKCTNLILKNSDSLNFEITNINFLLNKGFLATFINIVVTKQNTDTIKTNHFDRQKSQIRYLVNWLDEKEQKNLLSANQKTIFNTLKKHIHKDISASLFIKKNIAENLKQYLDSDSVTCIDFSDWLSAALAKFRLTALNDKIPKKDSELFLGSGALFEYMIKGAIKTNDTLTFNTVYYLLDLNVMFDYKLMLNKCLKDLLDNEKFTFKTNGEKGKYYQRLFYNSSIYEDIKRRIESKGIK